ncbi:MAG: hypothetical protein HRT71_19505 [Flavobacteriales bacterium]|nr:hypothetical protein [Flavobacteriales bacterium]
MAITDLGQIDNINFADDKCFLTIADQLNWDDELAHLELLEKKLMEYVLFVKSGELVETNLLAMGKQIVIKVVSRFEIPQEIFLKASNQISAGLKENKIQFEWGALRS